MQRFNIKSAIQVCTWISSLMIILISDSAMAGKGGNPSQLSGHLTTALQGICHSLSNLGISTRTAVSEVKNPPMSVFLQAGNTSSKQYAHGQQVSSRKNRAKISSFPLMMGRRKKITSGQSILSPTTLMALRPAISWYALVTKSFTTSALMGRGYFEESQAERENDENRYKESIQPPDSVQSKLDRDYLALLHSSPTPYAIRSIIASGETFPYEYSFRNLNQGCVRNWQVPPPDGMMFATNYAYSTCYEDVCAIYFRNRKREIHPKGIFSRKIVDEYRDFRLVTLYRVVNAQKPEAWGVMRRLEDISNEESDIYTVRVTLEKNKDGKKALKFDYFTYAGEYFTTSFWPEYKGSFFRHFDHEVPWVSAREPDREQP